MTAGPSLPITVYGELRLERSLLDWARAGFQASGPARAVIDGTHYPCQRGAWAVWIPAIRAKFLTSVDGRLHCLHPNAPPRAAVLRSGSTVLGSGLYGPEDWRAAYETDAVWRAAENAVAARRLYAAGLGPRLLGLCVALRFQDGARLDAGYAVGIAVDDARKLPAKAPTRDAELVAAGLKPDSVRGAIRQQVNGYVVDLNSVVGVVPVDAEAEIEAIKAQILACAAQTSAVI